MRHLFLLLAVLPAVLATDAAVACTYVVNPNGTGDFPTIQAAIDAAEDGDIICLTDGTFTGVGNRDIDYLGKAIVVRSESGDPVNCVIDCEGTYEDTHHGFHFHSSETTASALENVTVTGGVLLYESGGGILIDGASPTIRGCHIIDNVAGSPANGGGICCLNGAEPLISGCTVSGNYVGGGYYGGNGGGIYCDETSYPHIEDCTILDNEAASGTWEASGGGIWCELGTILRCIVTLNDADDSGGGIRCGAATVSDCVVSENHGLWSGGLSSIGATITRCTFQGNTCMGDGTAGVRLSGGEIRSCVITGNSSVAPYTFGGIRAISGCVVDSCTVAGNTAHLSGGMYVSEALVSNSIIWGNCGDNAGSEEVYASSGVSLFTCCDVDSSKVSGPVDFVNPLNADPLFCAPDSCANAPTIAGDYHLTPDSPCAPENSPVCGRIGALSVGCDPLPGACCDPTGACSFVLEVNCLDHFLGEGIPCMPNPCDIPGACCAPDGTCTLTMPWACEHDFLGVGVPCEPNPCLVDAVGEEIPRVGAIGNITPNPSAGTVSVDYRLDAAATTRISVCDTGGRLVRTVLIGYQEIGEYSFVWDGKDDEGRILPAGVYFLTLQAGTLRATGGAVMIR